MRPFDPRLLRLAPEARSPVAVLAVAGVTQGIATVATAFALGSLVTVVAQGGELEGALWWVGALFVVRAALGWMVERVAARAGVDVSTALRRRVLSASTAGTADQVGVTTTLVAQGMTSIETYVARFLPTLVSAAVVPALAIGALVVVDWPSALVVVLTVPLLPVFAALIGRSTQEATCRRWAALGDLSGHFLDVVRGLPTLVSYGRGEAQVSTVRRVSDRHRLETMTTLRLAFLSSTALELLATISVALVAVTVGIRLAGGGLDLRTALIAILLAPEAYWPIRRVGAEFHAAADGAEALDAALGLLAPSRARGAATAPQLHSSRAKTAGVSVVGVTYTYPGSSTPVLVDVNLEAGLGLTVVTGPSGGGKSTLLEVIAGLRDADAGRGGDVPDADVRDLGVLDGSVVNASVVNGSVVPGSVGDGRVTDGSVVTAGAHLVSQRPFLLAGSLRQNVTLGNDAGPDQVWQTLDLVGLDEVVRALPDGIETGLGDDGFGLSAGQRARLALARASLSKAPVLLLDEPTAHLDASSVEAIHSVIQRLAETRTVIAVTHRSELVRLADHHVDLTRAQVSTAREPVAR